jgi:hypothetical protein
VRRIVAGNRQRLCLGQALGLRGRGLAGQGRFIDLRRAALERQTEAGEQLAPGR